MGRANPSFQKRQKEQKRKEKADDKRAARQSKGQGPDEGFEQGDGELLAVGQLPSPVVPVPVPVPAPVQVIAPAPTAPTLPALTSQHVLKVWQP